MKRCMKCDVDINVERKTCPLCGEMLSGEMTLEAAQYPQLQYERHINLAKRILLFLSMASIIITVGINLITGGDFWSFYVVLGVLYIWILFRFTIISKRNIARRLFYQMIALSLLLVGIERLSESEGWALNYVVPGLCVLTTLSINIIILSKQMRYYDLMMYLLYTVLISWVPLILYFTSIVDVLWPSITAASISVLTILGIMFFADRATKDEIKKRFHV